MRSMPSISPCQPSVSARSRRNDQVGFDVDQPWEHFRVNMEHRTTDTGMFVSAGSRVGPSSAVNESDGQWLACIEIRVTTGDGKTGLDMWLWVTADAVFVDAP